MQGHPLKRSGWMISNLLLYYEKGTAGTEVLEAL